MNWLGSQVYPNGFLGKQLDVLDKQRLASIAASIWAKNELRSAKFLNDDTNKVMINKTQKSWDVSIEIVGEKHKCQIDLIENDSFFKVRMIPS